MFQSKNDYQHLLTKVYYITSLKSNIISFGQMTEEGSRMELVDLFPKIFDRNETLLMKVKWLQNRPYKILMKDHQHLLKVSIGVGGKEGRRN